MCLKCNTGCASCDFSSSNCSTCRYDAGQDYFLQPTSLTCSLTCPTGYFQQSNNKCQKCTNGKYGNWVNGTTAACSSDCNPACTQCFNNDLNSCTACKNNGTDNFFLQPGSGSTQCSQTCPNGYTGSIATINDYKCVILTICSSTCALCSNTNDPYSCSSCTSSLANGLTY
jgi:hypothetical protein